MVTRHQLAEGTMVRFNSDPDNPRYIRDYGCPRVFRVVRLSRTMVYWGPDDTMDGAPFSRLELAEGPW